MIGIARCFNEAILALGRAAIAGLENNKVSD